MEMLCSAVLTIALLGAMWAYERYSMSSLFGAIVAAGVFYLLALTGEEHALPFANACSATAIIVAIALFVRSRRKTVAHS